MDELEKERITCQQLTKEVAELKSHVGESDSSVCAASSLDPQDIKKMAKVLAERTVKEYLKTMKIKLTKETATDEPKTMYDELTPSDPGKNKYLNAMNQACRTDMNVSSTPKSDIHEGGIQLMIDQQKKIQDERTGYRPPTENLYPRNDLGKHYQPESTYAQNYRNVAKFMNACSDACFAPHPTNKVIYPHGYDQKHIYK